MRKRLEDACSCWTEIRLGLREEHNQTVRPELARQGRHHRPLAAARLLLLLLLLDQR